MNRLESIKGRVKNKYGAVADGITDSTAQLQASEDVSYLLQRLERYEKALEKLHKHSEDETVANLHYSQLFVRRVCLDALDQLKD